MNINDVLNQSRNGADRIIRYNPFFPRFLISNGVEELAEAAGCYWLLDMLAAELAGELTTAIFEGRVATVIVEMVVGPANDCRIKATWSDDQPPLWFRTVGFTTFPEGEWVLFEIGAIEWDENGKPLKLLCHLISEH